MCTKKNTPESVYNSKMNRATKGHNITYPSYKEVISYIGSKPIPSPFFSYIMCHIRDYSRDLSVSDFFWNKQLYSSTIDKVSILYPSIQRQQIKKALQKLSDSEIKDVLEGKKLLHFKRPYSKTQDYYKSFIGTTYGSYTIKDFWKRFVKIGKTEYCFIVECKRCHRISLKRCVRLLNREGIFCLKCTCGLNRPHRNSAIKEKRENDILCISEYSMYSSLGMYSIIDSEYKKSDVLDLFGYAYF